MKIVINVSYGGFSLSDEAVRLYKEITNNADFNEYRFGDNRADEALVKVVEELGSNASSWLSDLRIIDIPDGLNYEIDEYDGLENIKLYIEVSMDELQKGLPAEKLNLLQHTQTIKVK